MKVSGVLARWKFGPIPHLGYFHSKLTIVIELFSKFMQLPFNGLLRALKNGKNNTKIQQCLYYGMYIEYTLSVFQQSTLMSLKPCMIAHKTQISRKLKLWPLVVRFWESGKCGFLAEVCKMCLAFSGDGPFLVFPTAGPNTFFLHTIPPQCPTHLQFWLQLLYFKIQLHRLVLR